MGQVFMFTINTGSVSNPGKLAGTMPTKQQRMGEVCGETVDREETEPTT